MASEFFAFLMTTLNQENTNLNTFISLNTIVLIVVIQGKLWLLDFSHHLTTGF